MTKTRSTKRALLVSLLALLTCVSMLVGSTFAWFTDSVTSTGNIIQSGTLDVTMDWADGTKAVPAEDSTEWIDASTGAIFNYDLWEPGYTTVRHIKIANKGTLALKYQLNILPTGEVSKLADVIDVYFIDPATQITDRTALNAADKIGTLSEVLAQISTSAAGELLEGESDTITIALKMQETAGNEYQDLSIGSEFSIQLLATQLTYEKDSFNELYDELAIVTSVDTLKAAIAQGGTIMLGADLTVDANETITVADGAEVVLEMNGHTIAGTSTETGANRAMFTVKGDMTVLGGTFIMEHTGANMGWSNLTAPFSVEGGSLTLSQGATVINEGGSDMAYAVDVNTTLGESVLNVNGATLVSSYIGVRIFNNNNTATGTVNYNDGIIEGKKNGYDIWAQQLSAPMANAIVNNNSGCVMTSAALSGMMYYIETPTMVNSVAELNAAVAAAGNGDVIALAGDITGALEIPQTKDVKFTIDGLGKEFAGVITVDGKSNAFDSAGVTIRNVHFTEAVAGVDACINLGVKGSGTARYTNNVTVENCIFDAPGMVGVSSYTGGDKNLTIKDCIATANAHSLAQLKGVHGVKIERCTVNSVRGVNLNNSLDVTIADSTFDVQKYAVRFGESPNTTAEVYAITNCVLNSQNADGDATVILRAGATDATLTLTNTTINGTIPMAGHGNANIITQ